MEDVVYNIARKWHEERLPDKTVVNWNPEKHGQMIKQLVTKYCIEPWNYPLVSCEPIDYVETPYDTVVPLQPPNNDDNNKEDIEFTKQFQIRAGKRFMFSLQLAGTSPVKFRHYIPPGKSMEQDRRLVFRELQKQHDAIILHVPCPYLFKPGEVWSFTSPSPDNLELEYEYLCYLLDKEKEKELPLLPSRDNILWKFLAMYMTPRKQGSTKLTDIPDLFCLEEKDQGYISYDNKLKSGIHITYFVKVLQPAIARAMQLPFPTKDVGTLRLRLRRICVVIEQYIDQKEEEEDRGIRDVTWLQQHHQCSSLMWSSKLVVTDNVFEQYRLPPSEPKPDGVSLVSWYPSARLKESLSEPLAQLAKSIVETVEPYQSRAKLLDKYSQHPLWLLIGLAEIYRSALSIVYKGVVVTVITPVYFSRKGATMTIELEEVPQVAATPTAVTNSNHHPPAPKKAKPTPQITAATLLLNDDEDDDDL
jgi:hypothetical protein